MSNLTELTEEEMYNRLAKLKNSFSDQWYGLDNASDKQIVDALFYAIYPESV